MHKATFLFLILATWSLNSFGQISFPFMLNKMESIKKADSLFLLGDYELATKHYESVIELVKFSNSLGFQVVSTYIKAKKFSEAIELLDEMTVERNYYLYDTIQLKEDSILTSIRNHSVYGEAIWNKIFKNTVNFMQSDSVCTMPDLRNRLIDLKKRDQMYRGKNKVDSLWNKQKFYDSLNLRFIDSLFNVHPNLGLREVGWSGQAAIFLIVQHADDNLNFQAEILKRMEKPMLTGNIILSRYAMLIDRYNFNKYGVQIFGTQLHYYIDQNDISIAIPKIICYPEYVDLLRRYFGLPSLSRYLKDMTDYANKINKK